MSIPNVPRPDAKLLPDAEHRDCDHVAWLLPQLDSYMCRFSAALRLLIHCHQETDSIRAGIAGAQEKKNAQLEVYLKGSADLILEWKLIALRDTALTIYHFGRVLDGLMKATHRCPTLLRTLDSDKLRSAQPLFRKCFPHAERMRNAVAHASDIQHSADTIAKNAFDGEINVGGTKLSGPGMTIGALYHGWSLSMTNRKDLVTVELHPSTHNQMLAIVDLVYEAFSAHAPPIAPESGALPQSEKNDDL